MDEIDEIIQRYKESHFEYEQFLCGVRVFF